MKLKLLLLSTSLVFGIAFAKAEAAPGLDISAVEYAEGDISTEKQVQELLDAFLEQKGWVDGTNTKGSSFFIVARGTGLISAPVTYPNYNSARGRAFTKAMLEAKSELATYLSTTIQTAAAHRLAEVPEPAAASPEEQVALAIANMPDESVCGKMVTLVHKTLDNALKEAGYDAAEANADAQAKLAEAKAKVKDLATQEAYTNSITVAANAAISGLQAFYTAEANGEIGVITIWSPKLAETSAAMVTGKSVAKATPKAPIATQIPQDATTLLSTFGVQQKINEKGDLVLVAYAQTGTKSESKNSKKIAERIAADLARAELRNFAGETAQLSNALEDAETLNEYTDGSVDYKDERAYESFVKTAAAKMELNGVQIVKRWAAKHPVSGRTVVGAVATWCPTEAQRARKNKALIESSAKDGAAGKRSVHSGETPSTQKMPTVKPSAKASEYLGSGSSGDDDAF